MQKDQRRVNPEPRVERGAGHAYASPGRDQTYVEIAHCLKEDATERSAHVMTLEPNHGEYQ